MPSRKVNRRTRRSQPRGRNTVNSKVLDVRSKDSLRLFENLMVNGPLTLVFARLEGCGPCERFKKDVWSPLTKLKNKGMNMAMIESQMLPKTSLANVPTKFYPTLMLVGPDKKAATFLDENGEPTNSMPRKNTMEEDRETLTALLQSPNTHPIVKNNIQTDTDIVVNTESLKNTANAEVPNAEVPNAEVLNAEVLNAEALNAEANEEEEAVGRTIMNLPLRNEMSRQIMKNKPASPYEGLDGEPDVPSVLTTIRKAEVKRNNTAKRVPNVASDLLASQASLPTGSAEVLSRETPQRQGGGRMLRAIREHTKSLEGILRTRQSPKTRKAHV
ncbi:hypothetical protein EBV26_10895 [bacterium]|nr:hypothetical protein [bacterium]